MKHISLISLTFLLGLALSLSVPERAEAALTCPDDYYGFILTVRSENTRQEGVKDVFTRSYCQLNDLMALDDELDSLRENFRAAAFDCADTTAYKEEYHRILMEQYFVRNVQKVRSDVISSSEGMSYELLRESILTALRNDMESVFVEEEQRVSAAIFDNYFDNWVAKYDDRITDYVFCEEGAWAELTTTWEDFVETIESLSIDIEVKKIDFSDNISIDNDVDNELRDIGAEGRSVLNTWESYINLMSIETANVETPADIADIVDSGDSFTFGTAMEVLETDTTRAIIEAEGAERRARYRLLYGEGGAVASTDMQGIIAALNQIISETNTKDFPNVITGVSKVYDRQCN